MTSRPLSAEAVWRSAALGARTELDTSAGLVTVFRTGSGVPLVLVHGLLVNANLWRWVVPELVTAGHHCVTIDLPFGSHDRPQPGTDVSPSGLAALVVGAIEALDLGPVVLVGNDSGGAVCQLVATSRPDLLAGLVLTSCDAYEHFPPPLFRFLPLLARVPGGMAGLRSLRARALRRLPLTYGWLATDRLPDEVSDSYALPAATSPEIRADVKRLLRRLDPAATLAAASRFGACRLPVLIAWSADDKVFGTAHARRLHGDLPHSRLQWIADSRTLSPEDQPVVLAHAVAGFVVTSITF